MVNVLHVKTKILPGSRVEIRAPGFLEDDSWGRCRR